MKYAKSGEIPAVEIKCPMDRFENIVREMGVAFACEWFGHDVYSDFTKEAIITLCERSGIRVDINELD